MEISKEMGKDCGSQSPGSGSQSDRNIHDSICISRTLGPTSFCQHDQQAELPWFRVMINQVFKHQAEFKVRENVRANPSLETSHLEVETPCLSVL